VYIPRDVEEGLGLKENDEVDFFKNSSKSFIMAKKSDIAELLTSMGGPKGAAPQAQQETGRHRAAEPTAEELEVLKKLDTVRYADRTAEKLKDMLTKEEKAVLKGLIAKGFVEPYAKQGSVAKYGIAKSIYNSFLMRNRPVAEGLQQTQQKKGLRVALVGQEKGQAAQGADVYVKALQSNGFVVVRNEADASNLSIAMEDNIRHGLVLGTRAFNKRFYIATRAYINRNSSQILKEIEDKSMSAAEIAHAVGIDEDGVRAVLYLLAENGDVTEVRRDIFKEA
jgi:bifunctional DNA-binding transcriptional regulator/antitoxin component of YhaV-PrlF toxin-antitoxin module